VLIAGQLKVKELIEYLYDDALGTALESGAAVASRNDLHLAVQQLEDRTGGDEFTQEDLMGLFSDLFEDSSGQGVNTSSNIRIGSSGSSVGGGYTTVDTEVYDASVLGAGDSLMSQTTDLHIDTDHTDREAHDSAGSDACSGQSDEISRMKKQFEARIVAMNAEYKSSTSGAKSYLQIENFSVCPFMYSLQCLQKVRHPAPCLSCLYGVSNAPYCRCRRYCLDGVNHWSTQHLLG
jgi:hypothetical protein